MALRADDVDLDRDRALVQRFQAGDDEAFDELYRCYRDRLERFCAKRVADRHTAEEVTQEAFTRALSALPELGGDLRFYPWVSVIAARLCVDSYRRQQRSEPASDPDPGSVSGGQEAIVDAVDASLVVAALARLAPRHQDVLHLREVEGWSYQHIADHYGVTLGTVETLLFRARRALRREFHLADRAGLLALPVVGWLIRFAGRARSRVPSWVPSVPSPTTMAAAAGATAAALTIALVPVKTGVEHHIAAPTTTHAGAHSSARTPSVAVSTLEPPTPTTMPTVALVIATAGLAMTPARAPISAGTAASTTTTTDPAPAPAGGVAAGDGATAAGATNRGAPTDLPGALTSSLLPPLIGTVNAVVSAHPSATIPDMTIPALITPIVNLVVPPGPGTTTTTVPGSNPVTDIAGALLRRH